MGEKILEDEKEYKPQDEIPIFFLLPGAPAIEYPVIVFFGARHCGKTAVFDKLRDLEGDYEFYKVVVKKAWKSDPRPNEARAIFQSSTAMPLEEMMRYPRGFVIAYFEDDIIYGYPHDGFDNTKVPVVYIVGERGVENLRSRDALKRNLNIHLTVDTNYQDDLEERIISRLVATNEFPHHFTKEQATEQEKERIKERLDYTITKINYFREQKEMRYDAIFFNNPCTEDDPRFHIYNENPKNIATMDIALRIAELYSRWNRMIIKPSNRKATIEDVYHSYVTDVSVGLFNRGTRKRKLKSVLFDTKQLKRMIPLVVEYAAQRSLDSQILLKAISQTCIVGIDGNQKAGRFSVILQSIDKRPIYLNDVKANTSIDIDMLGLLAQRAQKQPNIFMHYGPRPRFVVENGIVKGALWSLTDENIRHDISKGRVRYHELFVGFDSEKR